MQKNIKTAFPQTPKQSKANSETNRSKKRRGHPQLLSQQQRILSNPLETRCTLSCLRLRDLNCLGSYLARIPNSLCFVVALDILKRPITQPHAIVMSVIGVRTGFGELFHAATQGIGVVLARTWETILSRATHNRIEPLSKTWWCWTDPLDQSNPILVKASRRTSLYCSATCFPQSPSQ